MSLLESGLPVVDLEPETAQLLLPFEGCGLGIGSRSEIRARKPARGGSGAICEKRYRWPRGMIGSGVGMLSGKRSEKSS